MVIKLFWLLVNLCCFLPIAVYGQNASSVPIGVPLWNKSPYFNAWMQADKISKYPGVYPYFFTGLVCLFFFVHQFDRCFGIGIRVVSLHPGRRRTFSSSRSSRCTQPIHLLRCYIGRSVHYTYTHYFYLGCWSSEGQSHVSLSN